MKSAGGTSFDVVVFGYATLDRFFYLRESVRPGGKVDASSSVDYAGGQAANVAVNLSLLGLRVAFIGAVGDDYAGGVALSALTRAGVNTDRCRMIGDCPTHEAVVLVDHCGERTIVMSKDARLDLHPSTADEDLLTMTRSVYSDGHELEYTLWAFAQARRHGATTFSDLESVRAGVEHLLPLTDELVAPEAVVLQLGGTRDVARSTQALRGTGPSVVVATQGAAGSVGAGPDGTHAEPAARLEVVDTTGAGDAYHAGYIAARLEGWPVAPAMSRASRVAEAACVTVGPRLTTTFP